MSKHLLLIIFWLMNAGSSAQSFAEKQKAYPRVKKVYAEEYNQVKALLKEKNFSLSDFRMYVRIFKEEEELEVWIRHKNENVFVLFYTVPVCYMSGGPGPKRREGDGQVPEGFYTISQFNPQSKFWLSLGINYPNASDRILSDKHHPGGQIYIHGNCVSIGCVAIRDNPIQRLYLLSVEARSNGQTEIPVHIFPCRMESAKYQKLKQKYQGEKSLLTFWEGLERIDQGFVRTKVLSEIIVQPDGQYVLK